MIDQEVSESLQGWRLFGVYKIESVNLDWDFGTKFWLFDCTILLTSWLVILKHPDGLKCHFSWKYFKGFREVNIITGGQVVVMTRHRKVTSSSNHSFTGRSSVCLSWPQPNSCVSQCHFGITVAAGLKLFLQPRFEVQFDTFASLSFRTVLVTLWHLI